MEVIDIGIDNLEPISSKTNEVNFGPGVELLMNDKSPSTKEEVNLNLDDIDNLEKEMNDLSSSIQVGADAPGVEEVKSDSLFSNMEPKINIDTEINDSNL